MDNFIKPSDNSLHISLIVSGSLLGDRANGSAKDEEVRKINKIKGCFKECLANGINTK